MSKGDNLLLIGLAAIAGVALLSRGDSDSDSDSGSLIPFPIPGADNWIPYPITQGGGFNLTMPGLGGGLNMPDLNIPDWTQYVPDWTKFLPDWPSLLPDWMRGPGPGTTDSSDSTNPQSQTNTFVQNVQAVTAGISALGDTVLKTGLTLGGGYVAAKYGGPLFRSVATAGGQLAQQTGQLASGALRSAGSIAGAVGRAMIAPVSTVPAVAVGAGAVAAGAAGFALGSWINTTAAGQKLQDLSGQAGASFARSKIGQAAFGVAKLDTKATDAAFSNIGMTTSQVQTYLKEGYTPSQIVRGDPLNKPQYPQQFGAATGTYSKDAPTLGRIVGGAR